MDIDEVTKSQSCYISSYKLYQKITWCMYFCRIAPQNMMTKFIMLHDLIYKILRSWFLSTFLWLHSIVGIFNLSLWKVSVISASHASDLTNLGLSVSWWNKVLCAYSGVIFETGELWTIAQRPFELEAVISLGAVFVHLNLIKFNFL